MCDVCNESYERVMNQGSRPRLKVNELKMYETRNQGSNYNNVRGGYINN